LRLALLEEILDLLLENRVLLGGLLGLATSLLGLKSSLKLDLHIASHLTIRHYGREDVRLAQKRRFDGKLLSSVESEVTK